MLIVITPPQPASGQPYTVTAAGADTNITITTVTREQEGNPITLTEALPAVFRNSTDVTLSATFPATICFVDTTSQLAPPTATTTPASLGPNDSRKARMAIVGWVRSIKEHGATPLVLTVWGDGHPRKGASAKRRIRIALARLRGAWLL